MISQLAGMKQPNVSLDHWDEAISVKIKHGLQKGFEPIVQCESMRRKIYEMPSVVVIHDVSPGSFAKYLGGDKRHTENYAEPIMEFQVWGANFTNFQTSEFPIHVLEIQFHFWNSKTFW